MDGAHDLGGMHGFGKIDREENEPPLHARWEAAVVASFLETLGAGLINLDELPHAIERVGPADYLAASYWERWLDGLVSAIDKRRKDISICPSCVYRLEKAPLDGTAESPLQFRPWPRR